MIKEELEQNMSETSEHKTATPDVPNPLCDNSITALEEQINRKKQLVTAHIDNRYNLQSTKPPIEQP